MYYVVCVAIGVSQSAFEPIELLNNKKESRAFEYPINLNA